MKNSTREKLNQQNNTKSEPVEVVECELDEGGSYLGYSVLLSVGGMGFCLKSGFCERAVVEGCLMVFWGGGQEGV